MSGLRVARGVLDIAPYVPGRSSATGGARTIRLASNETPLGASPLAVEAFRRCAGELHRYPDGSAAALREAIGARHGLDPARIVCGNGSDDLLYLLAAVFTEPGDEALFTEHAFAIYRIAAQAAGAAPVAAPERNLTADADALLARAGPNTRICYLANPNNPTGTYIPAAELARLRAGLPEHCLLVVDAAYAEYMRGGDYSTGAELADSYGNVAVTRSFSKIYGLSSLRLGWLYGPPAVVDALNRARAPFNVNRAAQEAGVAAVGDAAFVARAAAHNDEWRPWLERETAALGSWRIPRRRISRLWSSRTRPGAAPTRPMRFCSNGELSRAGWRITACRAACVSRSGWPTKTARLSRRCAHSRKARRARPEAAHEFIRENANCGLFRRRGRGLLAGSADSTAGAAGVFVRGAAARPGNNPWRGIRREQNA